MSTSSLFRQLRHEWPLALGIALGAGAFFFEHQLEEAGRIVSLASALALIVAIVLAAIRVAHHAEVLAHRVGDPYGSMILTITAVAVEVLILAILLTHTASPTLVRDTIYSAVILDINGILGLAALLGGMRHGEQAYNDDSGRTYGVMILTAMSISMVVPEFVPDESRHLYSIFTILSMILLYGLFVRNQVGTHSYFFSYSYPRRLKRDKAEPSEEADDGSGTIPLPFSIGVLVAGVAIIGFLAESMSGLLTSGLGGLGTPPALMAVVVAAISASPEILTALRSALANRMQAVINIALGASLSTVILTVPVMEAIALFTGHPFEMAMTPVQTMLIAVTLITAAINLNDGETNAIEGMTHFVLFMTFLMLTAIGL